MKSFNKIPVLLLVSTPIKLEALNQSPRFLPYYFFAFNAMQHLRKPRSADTSQGLFISLENKIKYIKPTYLIVHLGLAFERYPTKFLNAVLDVKEHFPELKVGLDRGLEYVIQHFQILVNTTPEEEKLVNKLVKNQSFFVSDKETVYLASCLL